MFGLNPAGCPLGRDAIRNLPGRSSAACLRGEVGYARGLGGDGFQGKPDFGADDNLVAPEQIPGGRGAFHAQVTHVRALSDALEVPVKQRHLGQIRDDRPCHYQRSGMVVLPVDAVFRGSSEPPTPWCECGLSPTRSGSGKGGNHGQGQTP